MNIFLRSSCRFHATKCLARTTCQLKFFSSSTLPESTKEGIPIIRVPKYLEQHLGQAVYKEHKKVAIAKTKRKKSEATERNCKYANRLIISSSGDKRLFHYHGYRYNPDDMWLISKKWLKETKNGEKITIHPSDDANPSTMSVNSEDAKDKTFGALGLEEPIIQSIQGLVGNGKTIRPSSIQYGVIPLIIDHRNVILSAETGSGKTIAYLAPIIQMIDQFKRLVPSSSQRSSRSPLGLVILPSRELAEQVGRVAKELASGTKVGVAIIIGGAPKHIAHTGLDLVVATVGILDSHLNKNFYNLNHLHHLVLDEADSLLDDSFSFDVMALLESLNIKATSELNTVESTGGTQLICSSATSPSTLDSTIGTLLSLNDDIERVTTSSLHCLHPNVKHQFFRINRYEKELKLMELLKEDIQHKHPVVIFANRTNAAHWLYKTLNENDIPCCRLTSDMEELERAQSFDAYQTGKVDILIATDLGSRGLDTIRTRHVINYDCPHFVADYIHRAGRTGRLGSTGRCLVSSLVSFKPDVYMLIELETSIRLNIPFKPNANIKSQLSQRWADKREKLSRNS